MRARNSIFSLFICCLTIVVPFALAQAQSVLVPQKGVNLTAPAPATPTASSASSTSSSTSAAASVAAAPALPVAQPAATASNASTSANPSSVISATIASKGTASKNVVYITQDQQNKLIAAQKAALAAIQNALDSATQSNAAIVQNVNAKNNLPAAKAYAQINQSNGVAYAAVAATGQVAMISNNAASADLQAKAQQIQNRLAFLTAGPIKTTDLPKLFQ